jgi:hypothetical protein
MILSLRSSMPRVPSTASSGDEKRSIISIAASLAPPCSGPRSEPMAAVMQEYRSDRVERKPGGEGRGVELVLGVEDQRHVHHFDVQLARLLAVQQVQEVAADGGSSVTQSMRLPSWLKRYQ